MTVVPLVKQVDPLQVVCWQLTIIAVLLVIERPWPVLAAVSVTAAVIVALTAVRVRRRWLYEWVTRYLRYLARNRDMDLPESDEKPHALLDLLAAGAAVHPTTINNIEVGVITRPSGMTAVLRPRADIRLNALPGPESLLPMADEQPVPFGIQVVSHAGLRHDRPPRVWIAVHAERTVDVHRDEELIQALGNALRRVMRRLARERLTTDPLTADDLLAALAALGHVNAGRGAVREDWDCWRTGPVAQVTLRVTDWDTLAAPVSQRLTDHVLAAVPGTAVTVTRSAHGSRSTAVLRIAATEQSTLDAAIAALTRLAGHYSVSLDRLDGMHPAGVAASLPIGGFPG